MRTNCITPRADGLQCSGSPHLHCGDNLPGICELITHPMTITVTVICS
jgi:hypothetical protein